MAGYFGTDEQKALQKRYHARAEWMANTPGIYNSGRAIGCEDFEVLGFDAALEIYREFGALGFRMVGREAVEPQLHKFELLGARIDRWDVFVGSAEEVAGPVAGVLDAGDVELVLHEGGADDASTLELQKFCANNGIAPFPGYLLCQQPPQAMTATLLDTSGKILAMGHAYFPHNRFSPFARYGWVGLVSVAEQARGFGLGRYINAALVQAAVTEMGASHVVQMAARDNFASRRMIEASGLQHRSELDCGVISLASAPRMTR